MNAFITMRRMVLALALASVGIAASPTFANAAEAPTVHLVSIGDLDVGKKIDANGKAIYTRFGTKVAEDARHIVATFEGAFAKAGKAEQLQTHLILGESVTPENVLGVIGRLNVKPNDTMVVLYSGHGAMDIAKGQLLTFHHGVLERSRLLDALKAKNPRLTVLLTDCCSAGPGIIGKSIVPQYEPKAMKNGDNMEWSTVNSLFFRHNGLVNVTAAEPGYCGNLDLVKQGSLFTNALVRVLKTPNSELVRHLDKDRDGQLQWDELLPQLRGLAAQYNREQTDGPPQQAYATSLGRWIPAPRVSPNPR